MRRSSPPAGARLWVSRKARRKALGLAAALGLAWAAAAPAQDLASFEKRVKVHVLDNGWTFLLLERRGMPVFTFATLADVGSAQEVPGITGLAHMFEHMAFKGTHAVGTRDPEAEKKALDAVEAAYQAYEAARRAPRPDPAKVEKLLADFRARQEEAAAHIVHDEFSEVINKNGGVGLNAFTSNDVTAYFYSLPSNKLELFAYLESERFLHPVFREFYKERDVVQEERRMSTDSSPVGRLFEQFLATAFIAHPYRQPTVGYMSDLESFSRTDAERFFAEHYAPANLTTAVVGDFDTTALTAMIEKYFGRIPARPRPAPLATVEPPQIAEKVVVLEDAAQPVYIEGYHIPAVTHPDYVVHQAIDYILVAGRSSRLHRALVLDQKVATTVASFSGFPGNKYPTLTAVLAFTAQGATNEQVQAGIRAEIERMKSEDVADEELARFRRGSQAGLVRSLRTNEGLAFQLADAQRAHGDWREVFRRLDRVGRVSKADIRRVAAATYRPENRTVAMIRTVPGKGSTEALAAAPAAGQAGQESKAIKEGKP